MCVWSCGEICHLSIYLSSVYLSIICLSSIYNLPVYHLSVCISSIYLSVCLSVCLSVYCERECSLMKMHEPKINIECLFLLFSILIFETGSHSELEAHRTTNLDGQWDPSVFLPQLPEHKDSNANHHLCRLKLWVLGTWAQALKLMQWSFFWPSQVPSP